jgi:CRP-like cAMP-binding protein
MQRTKKPAMPPQRIVNRLIKGLARKDSTGLLEQGETVELRFGEVLCEPQQIMPFVYFPLSAFISLVDKAGDHTPLEMGIIGNEGMLGASLILGTDEAQLRAIVQGKGTALRLTVPQLKRRLRASPALVRIVQRYLYVITSQLARSVTCIHFHELEPRLARWLLLTHDRAHADHFYLTHEYLAGMLGVRRSGVTVAAGALQRRSLIRYSRGDISIVDRKGLEAASCECYQTSLTAYRQLLHS